MAIYHLTAKAYSRKDGHSSTAGAAYRAGVCIEDARTGETHDYTRRKGVAFSALCMPGGATADRGEFWNAVEAHHKRGDAITCREVEVALPAELSDDARRQLAQTFAQHLADTYGVAADLAIHEPSHGGDERNHHAHILLSACSVSADGTLGKKAEALDPIACKRAKPRRPTLADAERPRWADMVNAALEWAGAEARVDHRSLVDQQAEAAARGDFKRFAQLDRIPTRHEGKALTQARRKGERPKRVRRNDRIQRVNDQRLAAQEDRFRELKAQAKADGRLAEADEQTLHARALLERRQDTRARLREAAEALLAERHAPEPNPFNDGLDLSGVVMAPATPTRPPLPVPDAPTPRSKPASTPARKPAERKTAKPTAARPVSAPRVRHRVIGDGTREGQKVAEVANLYLAALEESIANLLRNALDWARNHLDPWPRSLARQYLHAEGEAQIAKVAHDHAVENISATRRAVFALEDQVDRGKLTAKGAERVTLVLGWVPKTLRDLQEALKLARAQEEEAPLHAEATAQALRRAQAEADRHRNELVGAYQQAHPEEVFRFAKQAPDADPFTDGLELEAKTLPGAGSSFQPPTLKPPTLTPPRFRRPKDSD